MALIKTITSFSNRIFGKNYFIPKYPFGQYNSTPSKYLSTTKKPVIEDENENQPFKFSQTKAATWKARESRSGPRDDSPWYQSLIVSGSLAVFLIYFCILREENDIDQKLSGSLYDHIEGLEEKQIEIRIAYNKDNNLDTKLLEKRLIELRAKG